MSSEDRAEICDAVSEMLDNPDESGIYPTTRCYDRLEKYIESVRRKPYDWTEVLRGMGKEKQ